MEELAFVKSGFSPEILLLQANYKALDIVFNIKISGAVILAKSLMNCL